MIKVYTLPKCLLCMATKQYLQSLGVTYEEADAIENMEVLKREGITTVPVVEVSGKLYQVSSLPFLRTLLQELEVLRVERE